MLRVDSALNLSVLARTARILSESFFSGFSSGILRVSQGYVWIAMVRSGWAGNRKMDVSEWRDKRDVRSSIERHLRLDEWVAYDAAASSSSCLLFHGSLSRADDVIASNEMCRLVLMAVEGGKMTEPRAVFAQVSREIGGRGPRRSLTHLAALVGVRKAVHM